MRDQNSNFETIGSSLGSAFEPADNPQLYEGVVTRRVMAFGIDLVIVVLLTTAVYILTFFLGFLTFGLAWLAFGLIYPGVALIYAGLTLSSPRAATIGMRVLGIHMITWSGRRVDFMLGVLHALGFYLSIVALTPFSLAVALFEPRGRLVHDLVLGTVVVESQAERHNL
jgi:uncharacterized RDD family membrane protein YckC